MTKRWAILLAVLATATLVTVLRGIAIRRNDVDAPGAGRSNSLVEIAAPGQTGDFLFELIETRLRLSAAHF